MIDALINSLKKQKDHKRYFNISDDLAYFLSEFVKIKKPKNVLEIGTSNGFSGLHIIKNLDEDANFTSIEIDKTRAELAKKNFKLSGFKNYKIIEEDVFSALSGLSEKFDFIFLDAMQRKYKEIVEIIIKKKLISKSSVLIADNVISHQNTSMKEFRDYVEKNFEHEYINMDSGFVVVFF
jgi:predicted O-methyltransferase YrrM